MHVPLCRAALWPSRNMISGWCARLINPRINLTTFCFGWGFGCLQFPESRVLLGKLKSRLLLTEHVLGPRWLVRASSDIRIRILSERHHYLLAQKILVIARIIWKSFQNPKLWQDESSRTWYSWVPRSKTVLKEWMRECGPLSIA